MSLAATLAADGMRPASFLPAIKCSNCGEEIEIARMGDHVCGNTSQQHQQQPSHSLYPSQQTRQARPTPPPITNPHNMPSWGTNNQQYQPPSPTSLSPLSNRLPTASFAPSPLAQAQSSPQVPQNHPSALLPAQAPHTITAQRSHPTALLPAQSDPLRATKLPLPPRINPDAANRPFQRSASPASPVTSVKSARSGSSNGSRPPMLRNMTNLASPLTRNRSPSPEMASNLDCAFPTFPTTSSNPNSRPGTSNGRKTPNSDRAPSRTGSRTEQRLDREPHGMEPRSVGTTAGESVLQRAHTLKSGPFDVGRRKVSADEKKIIVPSMPPPLNTAVQRPAQLDDNRYLQPQNTRQPSPASPRSASPPPAEFFEHRGRSSRTPTAERQGSEMPPPLRISSRSKTFPARTETPQEHDDMPSLARMPSEPMTRGRDRRPSAASSVRSDFPVRSSSRSRTRPDLRTVDDVPPVPKPVQHYRHLSKHAPSESASSASSGSRSFSNANSSDGPSPISSAASSIDAFSPLGQASNYDREERPKSERMRSAGYSTKKEQQNPGLRAEAPVQRSPPTNFARPRPAMPASTNNIRSMATLMETPTSAPSITHRQEPVRQDSGWDSRDLPSRARTVSPTKQLAGANNEQWSNNWEIPPPKHEDYDPYRAQSPNPAQRSRSKSNASSIYPASERRPSMPAPPMPNDGLLPPGLQRRNTSAKAACRGCKQIIEGKSVKASDGQLTGRWHKHCFTCQTCYQPFATADFYVINDLPYCKQHYHEQNGSVCFGCKRGIEGQYLETSASGPDKKYHPHCFTCHECRLILSTDYFEINGQAYCERHALAAMRGQAKYGGYGHTAGGYNRGGYGTPSGLHPGRRELMAERRTTKLMMM